MKTMDQMLSELKPASEEEARKNAEKLAEVKAASRAKLREMRSRVEKRIAGK